MDREADLVAYSDGSSVQLYRLSQQELTKEVSPCPEVLRGGLKVRAGALVVACTDRIAYLDPTTGEVRGRLATHKAPMTAVAFQAGWVAAGHRDGVVRIYSLSESSVREIHVPGPPVDVKALALSPDGRIVVVAWVQGSIWWWSLDEPERHHELRRYEREADALAFSGDGTLLVEEGEERQTSVWRFAAPPTLQVQLRQGEWVKCFLVTPDAEWLVRAGSEGIDLAEIRGPRRIELDARAPVEDAAFDEGATIIAAADRAGRLTLFGVASERRARD